MKAVIVSGSDGLESKTLPFIRDQFPHWSCSGPSCVLRMWSTFCANDINTKLQTKLSAHNQRQQPSIHRSGPVSSALARMPTSQWPKLSLGFESGCVSCYSVCIQLDWSWQDSPNTFKIRSGPNLSGVFGILPGNVTSRLLS